MSRSWPRGVRWALQLALTLLVTYFLFRSLRLSWDDLVTLDARRWGPRPFVLLASVAALLAIFVYLVALWKWLIRALEGPDLRLGEALRIFFLANLGRYIPGKLWQLVGLTYLAGKRGVGPAVASSSAVLGQAFGLAAAACVAAIGLALGATSGYPGELLPWALALAALVAALTMIPAVQRLFLSFAFRLAGRGEVPPRPAGAFGARWLALYLPAWVGYGIAFGLLWASFPALPAVFWPAAIGGFAGAYFLGYAAVFAPAGVGVREGVLAVLLAPWLGSADAAVLAVIARIWITIAELLPLAGIGAQAAFGRRADES